MILVKSISRFSRNTKDCLVALRELSSLGVTVRFEEDNIDTKTLTSEMMVSVFGSLAQQESLSISQNQQMSYRRRMEKGEFTTCSRPYGYLIADGKNLVIYEPEAKWVRWIFQQCLAGNSAAWIADALKREKVPNKFGVAAWSPCTVKYILHNEKYIGDSLCQKTYTEGFPFVGKRNHGEKTQYYIHNTHPAIITRDVFERIQALLSVKGVHNANRPQEFLLSRKITCGSCGTTFMHRTLKNGEMVWCCRKHNDNSSACEMPRIMEHQIHSAFIRMYNKLTHHYKAVLAPALMQLTELEAALHKGNPRILELNKDIADAAEQNHKLQQLMASGVISSELCAAKASLLNEKMRRLRQERKRLLHNEEISETIDRLNETISCIKNGPAVLNEFDAELFESLIVHIVAVNPMSIRFQLIGGLEITESLEDIL